jgi:UDP-2-acetamido-3-amino-2,3-dideoxy-glucuronate N-acetyltransferase
MNTPRIGVLGAGHWGTNLLRNFAAINSLTAFCEIESKAFEQAKNTYPDVSASNDVSNFLQNAEIDAVAIATPAPTHGDLAMQCLEAGKHVFVEKPLTLDANEASMVIKLAAKKNLCLMVGHLLLYHPAFVKLSSLVSRGEIGELRYIYSNRLSLGRVRRDENALWSFAPHDISMILQLAGKMPEEVATHGAAHIGQRVADTTLSYLKFSNNLHAHIFVSWLHPYKEHRLVVVGSRGMIVFNDAEPNPDKLLLFRHITEMVDHVPFVNKAEAEKIPYEEVEPLAAECQHFVEAILNSTTPRSDGHEGIRVLQVLDACQRSLDLGQKIVMDNKT